MADAATRFSAASGYDHNYGINFVTGWAAVVPRPGGPPPTAPGSSGTFHPSRRPRVRVARSGRGR